MFLRFRPALGGVNRIVRLRSRADLRGAFSTANSALSTWCGSWSEDDEDDEDEEDDELVETCEFTCTDP